MAGWHSLIYIGSRVLPSIIGFISSMVLTWLLTPVEYGRYGLGLAVAMLVSNVFFEWHGLSVMRFFHQQQDSKRFLPTVFAVYLALCGVSALLTTVLLATGLLSGYEEVAVVCTVGSWMYFWFELHSRVQVALFRPSRYFVMNLVRSLAIFAAGSLAAWLTGNALAVLVAAFCSMFTAGFLFRPQGLRLARGLIDPTMLRTMAAFGWPIAITMTLSGMTSTVNRPILEALSGPEAVGFFTVAFTIAQNSINVIASGVAFATYSAAVKATDGDNMTVTRAQLSRNGVVLLGLLLPSTIGVAMLAPQFAHLLVSPRYVEPVALLTPWMAAAALLSGLRASYIDYAFQLGHRTTVLAVLMAVMAFVNIALNFILIPRFGFVGAGAAMTVGYAVGLVAASLAAQRCFPLPYPWREYGKIAIASAALALTLWSARSHHTPLWLAAQIVAGGMVFCAAAVALDTLGMRQRLFLLLRSAWLGALEPPK